MRKQGAGKPQHATFLGLDIGGTCIKWGIVDPAGCVLRTGLQETRVREGPQYFLDSLCGLITQAQDVQGVGICTAGIVDSQAGTVRGGIENIPYLKGLELRRVLEERTGRRVRVINDVNAAALGESWVGAGKGCQSFFCVTIGTGIGGSLMIGGKIHEGAHFQAGEIGYLHYAADGSCLETQFSAKALMCAAQAALGEEGLVPDMLFGRVAAGEPPVRQIFDAWIQGLGGALADTLLMLDPEKLIVGGGITERGALLLDPLDKAVRSRLPREMRGQYVIELAKCGNNAGILGAVRNFMLSEEPAKFQMSGKEALSRANACSTA